MTRLTPTESRRLRESAGTDDPMFLAEAEAAFEDALAEAESPRVYIGPAFCRASESQIRGLAAQLKWRESTFDQTGCVFPHVNVLDGPNLELDPADPVMITEWGRLDAFRHGGRWFLIAYS